MQTGLAYDEFIKRKVAISYDLGFAVEEYEINPLLKPHQRAIVKWMVAGGRRACFAAFGLGKCHGAGTKILMADCSIKNVEDIKVGEQLMGDDGKPRTVLSLSHGREAMYRITLRNGDSYTCNESHIISLQVSNRFRHYKFGERVDMRLCEWLTLPDYAKKNCFKHYKVPLDFYSQNVPMDPYLYGAWLGDGSARSLSWTINNQDSAIVERIRLFADSKGFNLREEPQRGCTFYHVTQGHAGKKLHCEEFYFVQDSGRNGKRIDARYLQNSRDVRLQLLAGLIDTDGSLIDKCFEVSTKWEGLKDDILFLCRSLGFSVSYAKKIVRNITYWRIWVSGDTHLVPCITRKKAGQRKQIKNPLVYGFDVEPLGAGDYYGFEIDGNRRYLLADFTVTHNTIIQLETVRLIRQRVGGMGLIVLPLGVRQEFTRDARMLDMEVKFIRRIEDASDPNGIYLTNYETIRDGKLDPRHFTVASLDEAACLRGFGGTKTFREFMRLFTTDGGPTGNRRQSIEVHYRFVATATPSPNEYIELLAYAAFLGILDVSQAKTRFFKRDSTQADNLTILPHKEQEFWLWVASWAIFLQKPSDLGYSDEGYVLPELDVRWHEINLNSMDTGYEKWGQGRLLRNAALGVQEAAREKRISLHARIEKIMEIRAENPAAHRLLWHDLESERYAIEKAIPDVVSIYGSQDLEKREDAIIDFSDGKFQELAAKPVIAGSGCNFQRHCSWAIYLGIGFKFNDFIQSIHRIQRFLQSNRVRIDLIYTDAEQEIRKTLERKWTQHKEMVQKMTEIIKEFGLSQAAISQKLKRALGVERIEVTGERYRLINNDTVIETRNMKENTVGLILTSIPFSTQYEYTPNYCDFGHTDNNEHFFEQLDYLTPELFRVLQPGRIAAIHVKDRIIPSGLSGHGFQVVYPLHARCIDHYTKHGFGYMGMKTIVTDVVRENNQTYRLGWTEQCKDGSKMGVGMPEYLLIFRKPPTDNINSYADNPVVKSKRKYTRAKWQIDAHGFARSSGNRLLMPEELTQLSHDQIFKLFRDYSLNSIYDFEHHVKIGEELDEMRRLPVTFMLLQPQSWHPDVWTDITRMLTLNSSQSAKGKVMHLCPMQFDLADRAIEQWSMHGEVVLDPFGGIMTVPYRAILLGRYGMGIELSPQYFADGAAYCKAAEEQITMPDLFAVEEGEYANKN